MVQPKWKKHNINMSAPLTLGAIDVETKQYVFPYEAVKGKDYRCIDCDQKVIFKKGELRKAHFAHYAPTNTCSYYEHPNESQLHKDAKLLMARLLTKRKNIQFIWNCSYPACYGTPSSCYVFDECPSIIYNDDDEVVLEHRDKDGKWIADVAIVNKGEVRYIIEIKHTHKTMTARPEPWYEVDATSLIQTINYINTDPELKDLKDGDDFIYEIGCCRTDIVRYCYGSFCYKEDWVGKIPGYDSKLLANPCLYCEKSLTSSEAVYDGSTGKFGNDGHIRVCISCLVEDIYKKRIRTQYGTRCYGHCFEQTDDGGYKQGWCPDGCKLDTCKQCLRKHPFYYLETYSGYCGSCNVDRYCRKNLNMYIDVPYARKDEVKALGVRWDSVCKKWYIDKDAKNKSIILAKFREIRVSP
jgi:hypothetical protein